MVGTTLPITIGRTPNWTNPHLSGFGYGKWKRVCSIGRKKEGDFEQRSLKKWKKSARKGGKCTRVKNSISFLSWPHRGLFPHRQDSFRLLSDSWRINENSTWNFSFSKEQGIWWAVSGDSGKSQHLTFATDCLFRWYWTPGLMIPGTCAVNQLSGTKC